MNLYISPTVILILLTTIIVVISFIQFYKYETKKADRKNREYKYPSFYPYKPNKANLTGQAILSITASLVISYLLLAPFTTFIGSRILVKNNTVLDYNFLWNWDDHLKGDAKIIFNNTLKLYTACSIQPITVNPKVRALKINLKVKARGSNESAILFSNRFSNITDEVLLKKEVLHYIRYYLFNFTEEKSKEIAKFYNPEDYNQQKEFHAIARAYLEPNFSRVGISIDKIWFTNQNGL